MTIPMAHCEQRGDWLLEQQLHPRMERWLIGFQPEQIVPPFSLIFRQMSLWGNRASPVTM